MGVPDDSPLRNHEQIPYLRPPPPQVQNPTDAEEKGDNPSIRALVKAIDSYVQLVDLEINSDSDALPRYAPSSTPSPTCQPTEDSQAEHGTNTAPRELDDPTI